MENIFKVISISEKSSFLTREGVTKSCRDVILQLPGNDYADKFACSMIGAVAEKDIKEGDIVVASINFYVNEGSSGRAFQNISVTGIDKLENVQVLVNADTPPKLING